MLAELDLLGRDGDLPAARHGFQSVEDDVEHRLIEFTEVAGDGGQVVVEVQIAQLPVRAVGAPSEPGHIAVWASGPTAAEMVGNAGDRAFLRELATRIVELDRGRLTSWRCDYTTYLQRKEALLEVEAQQNRRQDKKLAEEEAWIRRGIKARRTRNMGRVRDLLKMREERRQRRERTGSVKMVILEAERTGKLVFDPLPEGTDESHGPLLLAAGAARVVSDLAQLEEWLP